jgi:hypothetical protein
MTVNQVTTTTMKAANIIDLTQANYKLSMERHTRDPLLSKELLQQDILIAKAFRSRRHKKEISKVKVLEAWNYYLLENAKNKS